MFKLIKKYINNRKLKKVISLLKKNGLVAMPTNTVYGLFAIASEENRNLINDFKKSNPNKKLSVFFADKKQAQEYIELSSFQKEIFESELPGKKTVIFPLKNKKIFNSLKEDTLGIRIISKKEAPYLNKVIEKTGPLFSTSVNLTGSEPLNDYKSIKSFLFKKTFNGKKIYVVKQHLSKESKPSMIIDVRTDKISVLRGLE